MSALAPYERLLALAEHEASLVASGAWEDLSALGAERAASVAVLPPVPPPGALLLLERLAGIQAGTTAALSAGRAATADELHRLRRGRGAVQGYAAAGSGRVPGATGAGRLDGRA